MRQQMGGLQRLGPDWRGAAAKKARGLAEWTTRFSRTGVGASPTQTIRRKTGSLPGPPSQPRQTGRGPSQHNAGPSRRAEIGENVDGQQWIWVVMVLVGAALVAVVMVFGHQRRRLVDPKRAAKHRDGEPGSPADNVDSSDDEPAARSPNH